MIKGVLIQPFAATVNQTQHFIQDIITEMTANKTDDWSPEALERDFPLPDKPPATGLCLDSRENYLSGEPISLDVIKNTPKTKSYEKPFVKKKPRFTFNSISLNGSSKQMEAQMLKDIHVLEMLAILGQHTTIYAGPNFGKTLIVLWLIIESIKKGNFTPEDLLYINADDNYKGLTQKLKLAEKYGFLMTATGYNNFRSQDLSQMLRDFVIHDEASGKIIILDTLKKFTDLMDKKAGSEFGNIAREFTAKGGTIISLAHVNKKKDSEGKSVMAGTTDISDDADCVFIGDVISQSGNEKIVELRNVKDRGDVSKSVTFSYNHMEKDYYKLLGTVSRIDSDQAENKRKSDQSQKFIHENIHIIDYIKELIYSGVNSQKEIIKLCNENHSAGRNKTHKILTKLTGINPDDGKLWKYVQRDKNRYEYRLLSKFEGVSENHKT